MSRSIKILLSIITLVLLAFLIIVSSGARVYTDYLWFENLGFVKTFLIMFFSNFGIRIAVGLIFTLFIYFNLLFTRKMFLDFTRIRDDEGVESIFQGEGKGLLDWINKRRLTLVYLLGSIILGFLFSTISQDVWRIVLKYLNQTPFDAVDPIFSKDIAFYVFTLPFLNFIRELGMVLVVLTLIVIGIIYILASGISSFGELGLKLSSRAKNHMVILVSLFLFLKAWGYSLEMYQLLYSARGVAFGASYTDVNANLLGLKILFVIAIVVGVLLLSTLFKNNYKILFWGLGAWLLASIIFGGVYPGLVQRFQVEPNELDREREYINYNIDMTLDAYGLNEITRRDFPVENNLTAADLEENSETIDNIRLWDPRPLLSTYSQIQELRQYYNFNDVDIDRYHIDGDYRQVMLSARELDQSLLSEQAQTWINLKLKYTHGFGVVMSPVNKVTGDGMPDFFIKDIPPQVSVDIPLEDSSIYYGEKTDNYVIANNNAQEFHYPMGDQNVYTDYDGYGGVQLNNFFRKVLYSLRFSNVKLLLADDISPESRILYNRNIKERVHRVAPFLRFDRDPYLVIADGRLFWIQDAYTTTDKYPYSQPIRNLGNYIRNSIKIVIDAYNGSMDFYVVDEDDPLAATYQKIFPDLFVAGDEMPEVFRKHLRYPEDLFSIQSSLYSTYHMQDPTVFYNKEDLWNVPEEMYGGSSIQMEPYYIISQLPGEEDVEFILMLPFTPATKNNMVAWMAARSDGEHYGDLFVYNFPKDELVYGPRQIESRIDQDSEISQLLSLWSQRGSRVIRGNLLVIPIENSLLYVEPIYLQAEASEIPELKRVVVSYSDNVVMAETLEMALLRVFGAAGEGEPAALSQEQAAAAAVPGSIQELTQEAVELYQEARESQQEGNWAQYGEKIEELEDILKQLQEMSKPQIETEPEAAQEPETD